MTRAGFEKTMGKKLSRSKAKEILRHGSVRGHKLTKKQRGFFGAVAGGNSIKFGISRKNKYS